MEIREEMDSQRTVVAYNASLEEQSLLLEMLGSFATLTFLNGLSENNTIFALSARYCELTALPESLGQLTTRC